MTIQSMLFSSRRALHSFLGAAALLLMTAGMADAQSLEFSSSLNPVGSGARAVGMGGAFIGVADDATAASWNPAGLIQLEAPEVSAVYGGFSRKQEYTSTAHPETDGSTTVNVNGLNYASIVSPFILCGKEKDDCRNVVVSLNYQRLYEMEKQVMLNFDPQLPAPDFYSETINFEQQGYLYALSPAVAVQATPSLSLGLTLNLWKDYFGKNGWTESYTSTGAGELAFIPFTDTWTRTTEVDFEGFNANLGFLWNAFPTVTIGGVYKTGFNARISRHTQTAYADDQGYSTFSDVREQLALQMPASYGFGVQYRPNDALTIAFDAYRTAWSEFVLTDSAGNETNPLTGKDVRFGRPHSTTQMRFGAEYLFIGATNVIAVRGGVFSDPNPATGKADSARGYSAGTGYSNGKISVDLAYQRRMGNDMTGDVVTVADHKMDVTEQTFMLSMIYYFE